MDDQKACRQPFVCRQAFKKMIMSECGSKALAPVPKHYTVKPQPPIALFDMLKAAKELPLCIVDESKFGNKKTP